MDKAADNAGKTLSGFSGIVLSDYLAAKAGAAGAELACRDSSSAFHSHGRKSGPAWKNAC